MILVSISLFIMCFPIAIALSTQNLRVKVASFISPKFPSATARTIAATMLAGSALFLPIQNQIVMADDQAASITLTASDLKKNDLAPRISLLKDIQFVVNLLPSYIEKQDYVSIRQTLRSEPTVELRRTCKELPKYLDVADAKAFNVAYEDLIDSINSLDVTALKRMQGSGVPQSKDVKDVQMLGLIEEAATKFAKMLSVIASYQ